MELIQIQGGIPLKGTVAIQGSKNAALPVMAASVLVPGVTTIQNCPDISDVSCMCQILKSIGVRTERRGDTVRIDATSVENHRLPEEYVTRMRSSVILMGALLGRCGKASLYLPGGCVIGDRPIDLHLRALERLGARLQVKDAHLDAFAPCLEGCVLMLDFPSVGATENALLAAVRGKGRTEIFGCAREPEIRQLCDFLNGAGARISGGGSGHISVEGVDCLRESCYRVEADRIVAGTYLIGTLAAGGEVFLKGAPADQMESVLELGRSMGAWIEAGPEGVLVRSDGSLYAPETLETAVYPGFPTDLQSPALVALCRAQGNCSLCERIFNGRLGAAAELNRMGARIETVGNRARIEGSCPLKGCFVTAQELRGGAALVLAGLCADGVTHVCNRKFIDRGYEDICRDLRELGARIGSKTEI